MSDVTGILLAIEAGDPNAAEELLPLVYAELRQLAAHKMAQEPRPHLFQATDLVHEAYLRVAGNDRAAHWNSRGHFFAAAAQAMRRILIEDARRRRSIRQGGQMQQHQIDFSQLVCPKPAEDQLALDEALRKLADKDVTKARLVELRYFAGLTIQNAATILGISTTTAERYWNYSRAWLHQEMTVRDG